MCGIAGCFDSVQNEPSFDRAVLQDMSDAIVHRGPDDEGHYVAPNSRLGFAFRRLSIIDTSMAGHQPMTTPDGRYTIVFNGEIYNHRELRKTLEQRGCAYRSNTDSETLLYGLAEFGQDFVAQLRGMFAIAFYDAHKHELLLVRDRIGIKPLYYTQVGSSLIFGSEIKSILCHPHVSPSLNECEMVRYLSFSMTGHSTMFKGIHKLRPGHMLTITNDGNIRQKRYWHPWHSRLQVDSSTVWSSNQVEQTIMQHLRSAVSDRMMSDVPFGVFLSGGIDSSLNVALMSELIDRPVDSYSVGYSDLEKYNEMEYARKVATLFGTNHREILIDEQDAVQVMENLVWHEDEPNGDPVCIPLHYVSKLTRDSGTTVVQVGEGSDEQFVGYPWMFRELKFKQGLRSMYMHLPGTARKLLYNSAAPLFKSMNQFVALEYLRRASYSDPWYWGGATDVPIPLLERLVNTDTAVECARSFPAQLHDEISSEADDTARIEAFELMHRLPELLLMRVDKITMSQSLEARVPFLDHRLVEYTMSIPQSVKVPNFDSTKVLLKNASKTLLPDEIIHRRKQGFAAPVDEWFRSSLKSYARDILLSSPIIAEHFHTPTIASILNKHADGKLRAGKTIFSLIQLAQWHNAFFNRANNRRA